MARDEARGHSIPDRVRAVHDALSAEIAAGELPGLVLDTSDDTDAHATADRVQDAGSRGGAGLLEGYRQAPPRHGAEERDPGRLVLVSGHVQQNAGGRCSGETKLSRDQNHHHRVCDDKFRAENTQYPVAEYRETDRRDEREPKDRKNDKARNPLQRFDIAPGMKIGRHRSDGCDQGNKRKLEDVVDRRCRPVKPRGGPVP